MLADIDDACQQAGIWPDAFFSGHAHSLQRYTRSVKVGAKTLTIPHIVSGCGGHGGGGAGPPRAPPGAQPPFSFFFKKGGVSEADRTPPTRGDPHTADGPET